MTGVPCRIELRRLAHGEGLPDPAPASRSAAGLDLYAAVPEGQPQRLEAGAYALVPTGLTLAIPDGFEGQVRPRSGLAFNHGVTVLNSPGTIDADYRGEVGVLLINLGRDPVTIHRGERIAQLIVAPVAPVVLETVENLDRTERGEGGFGSTGRS